MTISVKPACEGICLIDAWDSRPSGLFFPLHAHSVCQIWQPLQKRKFFKPWKLAWNTCTHLVFLQVAFYYKFSKVWLGWMKVKIGQKNEGDGTGMVDECIEVCDDFLRHDKGTERVCWFYRIKADMAGFMDVSLCVPSVCMKTPRFQTSLLSL